MPDPRPRWDSEDGLSLIEVMIAVVVLAVALLALVGVASASLLSLRNSRSVEQASNAASAAIEDLRRGEFENLWLDPSTVSTCVDGEPTVTSGSGGAYPTTQTAGDGRPDITVTTTITWVDDPDTASSGCSHTDRRAKRVTVTAAWTDAGTARELVQSTLVAPAGRGLPVPSFNLEPPEKNETFDPTEVDTGHETCLEHSLRNTGEEDSYEWKPSKMLGSDGNEVTVGSPSNGVFETTTPAGVKWKVRGIFEYHLQTDPVSDPKLDPAGKTESELNSAPYAPYFELMKDTDGNARPETTRRLPHQQTARLWICYQVSSASVGDSAQFTISVNSRFDPNVVEKSLHTLSVEEQGLSLYLFDVDDTQDHARDTPSVMGPVTGIQPAALGTTTNSDGDIFNWDEDIDGLPGIVLQRGTSSTDAMWHRQFGDDTTLKDLKNDDGSDKDDATLTFWTRPPSSFTPDPDSGPAAQSVTVKIVLERLKSNEKPFTPTPQIVWEGTVSFDQDDTDWTERVVPIEWNEAGETDNEPIFKNKEYLRLHLSCVDGGDSTRQDADCLIGYDHDHLPARLVVHVK